MRLCNRCPASDGFFCVTKQILQAAHIVSIRSRHAKVIVPLGAALTAAGLALAFGAPSAGAQAIAGSASHGKTPPGDNGDVKIHRSTTAVTDQRNQPHVCLFYLDAFNFDPNQSVSWKIESWPPTGNRTVVDQGTITLDSAGNGFTSNESLPNGHFKLFWNFGGEHGFAKQKVFWVSCPAPSPTPTPTSPSPSPSSPGPTPSPPGPSPTSPTSTSTPSVPPAPVPSPVHTTLPVTG